MCCFCLLLTKYGSYVLVLVCGMLTLSSVQKMRLFPCMWWIIKGIFLPFFFVIHCRHSVFAWMKTHSIKKLKRQTLPPHRQTHSPCFHCVSCAFRRKKDGTSGNNATYSIRECTMAFNMFCSPFYSSSVLCVSGRYIPVCALFSFYPFSVLSVDSMKKFAIFFFALLFIFSRIDVKCFVICF